VRSDVLDPKHELRPGMLATFVIEVKPAAKKKWKVEEGKKKK